MEGPPGKGRIAGSIKWYASPGELKFSVARTQGVCGVWRETRQ